MDSSKELNQWVTDLQKTLTWEPLIAFLERLKEPDDSEIPIGKEEIEDLVSKVVKGCQEKNLVEKIDWLSTEILPCPFCGNVPTVETTRGGLFITCDNAGCLLDNVNTRVAFDEESALMIVEDWNARKN